MGQDEPDLEKPWNDENTDDGESTVTAGFRPMDRGLSENAEVSEDTVIIEDPAQAFDSGSDEVTIIDIPKVHSTELSDCAGPIEKPSSWSPGTSKLVPIFLEDEALFKEYQAPFPGSSSNFYPCLDNIRLFAQSDPFTPPARVWTQITEDETPSEEVVGDFPPERGGSGFFVKSAAAPYERQRPLWQYFSLAFLLTIALCIPGGYLALSKGHLGFLTQEGVISPGQIEHPHGLMKAEADKAPAEPEVTPEPTPCEKEKEWGRRDVLFRDLKLILSQDRVVIGKILGVQDCSLRFKEDGHDSPTLIPFENIVSSDLGGP